MDEALWSSARSILGAPDAAAESQAGVPPPPSKTSALDYGAYFDLALPYPSGELLAESVKHEARAYLASRLDSAASDRATDSARALSAPPLISNLSPAFYSPEQIGRFSRWWDIEPENAMGMTDVADSEFARVRHLIETAFARLRDCAPELFEEICTIISEIVVARSDGSQRGEFGGVSSFALWGAIAINFELADDWPTCLRSVVHEAAHNLLFGLARSEPLVADDPAIRRPSPLRQDPRPLDGIFHAAFVSARESLALDSLLIHNERHDRLTQPEVQAVEAMLENSVISFWNCVEVVRHDASLTPLGEQILEECETWMRANFALALQG
jgi:hypothetical protein